MNLRLRRRRGFTLLELLVVIAILATVAGGLLVAYDGLDMDAAEATATYNMAAIDKAVRTYRMVNKTFPDNFDSLMVHDQDEFAKILPSKLLGDDRDANGEKDPTTDDGKLAFYDLTANGAAALNAVGIRNARYIVDSTENATLPALSIPNRAFDDSPRGRGEIRPLAAGSKVAVIETVGLGTNAPADSSRLRDIAGLDANVQHIVVAFGLGNNCTMVGGDAPGSLSEAPWYTKVEKDEYGRFLVLFHLGSDENADGTVDEGEIFETAKFLGVLDTRGDWIDEEFAEYTNQKL